MKKFSIMAAILGITASAYTACPGSSYSQGQQYNTQGQYPQGNSTQGYNNPGYNTQRYNNQGYNAQGQRSNTQGYNVQGQRYSQDDMMMDDSSMKSNIQNMIMNPNVSVTFKEGVVTLSGKVGSDQEKRDLENRISNMKGVKRVDNQLKVSSSTSTNSY